MSEKLVAGSVFHRSLNLDRAGLAEESRTVPASLSSEIEVERFFGIEILSHDPDAVSLERVPLPLLWGHDHDQPIGLVENVRLDKKILRGDLRFSRNKRANEIWEDVRDGFLSNISIGYAIDEFEEMENGLRATKWSPHEASVVAVPADFKVGINRNKGVIMTDDTKDAATATETAKDDLNIKDFQMYRTRNLEEGKKAGEKSERSRIRGIRELFAKDRFQTREFMDLMDACIDNGVAVDRARDLLLEMVGYGYTPILDQDSYPATERQIPQPVIIQAPEGYQRNQQGKTRVEAGKSGIEKFREGAEAALLVRCDASRDDEQKKVIRQNEYFSMTPTELAREYLRQINVPSNGMSRAKLISSALTRAASVSHSTSDFAQILENVASKSLLLGYEEAEETWRMWCRTGTLPDFRQGSRPQMSAFGDLEIVYENGEYKYGSFSDHKETLQLLTYGKKFGISRQALVNDDLNALGRVPMSMGRAAARKVGDLPYNVLINGITATLNQDSKALFHADHSNYIASGSGAAPNVTTVNAVRTAMATQTDPSGSAILNVRPAYMLVPFALEGTARSLANAEYDPDATAGTLTPNTVRGTFQVIPEGRLDADSATKWYMAASPMMIDTVEVAFLEGAEQPYLESMDGWNVDGIEYKVRIDAVAAPLDFRGLSLNFGA